MSNSKTEWDASLDPKTGLYSKKNSQNVSGFDEVKLNKKTTKYILIYGDENNLVEQINQKLNDGWILYGNLISNIWKIKNASSFEPGEKTIIVFYQAMIRED